MAKKIARSLKASVVLRAKGLCEYCLCPLAYSTSNFSIEHIIPTILGGTDDLSNLALACQGCNGCKYTKVEVNDTVSGQMVSLYHPRQHTWIEHFAWSADFLTIVGLNLLAARQ